MPPNGLYLEPDQSVDTRRKCCSEII
jgi:hypothetical protein